MRAKALTISFITALALLMTVTATATDFSDSSLEVSGDYSDSDVNSEYLARISSDTLTVTDKSGDTVYTQSLPNSNGGDVEFNGATGSDAFITYQDSNNNPHIVYYTSSGSEWSYQMNNDVYPEYNAILDVSSNYVGAATKNGEVYILNKDGTESATYEFEDANWGGFALDEADNAFYLTRDGSDTVSDAISKHAIDSGNELWEDSLSATGGDLDIQGDSVYFLTDAGDVKQYSDTGSSTASTSITDSQVIEATNSSVVVGTSNGMVYESDLSGLTFGDGYDYGSEAVKGMGSYEQGLTVATDSAFRYYQGFTLPESTNVTEEATNLATGNFALSTSAGVYTGLKGISAASAGLATWELGIRDWIFGTNDADEQLWLDDIRANAVTLEDNRNNILSASKLSEDALFGDAMAEARAVGVQEYNNGSSKAQAKAKVENTVENYYSDVERVVVTGYNNEILNLQQDYNNAQDLGVSFSKPFKSDFNGLAIVNESYTLPNGESMTTYEVVRDDGARIATLESYEGVGLTTESSADHASASYLEGSAHYDVIQGVRDTRSNAITNVNSIVDNIYNNYNQSQINVSEELSALELVESLSTDYGETGSYDYAAASLARSGQPTDLDSAFNITYNGETMEGALFASDAVVGSQVDVGTTYNGSDGNAVFVKQGEASAELVELEGEFTVNSITSLDDGSELSNTTLQESSVYTNNIQDLQEEINNLETQLNEGSGIGGGLFSGLGADMYVILGLILVLAGALFA